MKPILLGAVFGLLWLLLGMPYTVPSTLLAAVVQPVTLAFAAGLYARPHLTRGRWTR